MLTFRPATEFDIPFLLDLRQQTMNEHLAAAGMDPSEDEQLDRILTSFDSAQIVRQHGIPMGLIKVLRQPMQWELIQIQLLPRFQKQGIGSQLMARLVQEARAMGVALKLSVLKTNPARRLYERMGFVVIAETTHAYAMALKT